MPYPDFFLGIPVLVRKIRVADFTNSWGSGGRCEPPQWVQGRALVGARGNFFGFSYEVGVNLGTYLMNTRKNIITYEAYKK